MFIVLEGIDGCGKSTHARLLADWFKKQGRGVYRTAEPTKSVIGKTVRCILAGELEVKPKTLALLFTADRMEHLDEIEAALDEGKTVVCERYLYSTVAYQHAQGVDWQWLLELNRDVLKPDIAFLLDIPVGEAGDRFTGEEVFERKGFLKEVKKNYELFPGLAKIDASGSVENTQGKIREYFNGED